MLLPLPYIQETLGDEATILFQSFSWSFAASCVLLVLWRGLIAPVVAANRSADDLVFLTNSVVSLFPALTAPFLAVQALWELPISDHATALAAAPTPLALRAVGLSCGYMAYDTVFCLAHKQVRHPLLLGHHLLSILFFPYATLRHRALLVVLFFVCTEVTNIGQHVRIILLKLGHERSRLYLVNGVAWAVSFFVVRILPSPYLFYKMADCSYAAFSRADFVVAWATMPIPFVLNSFWFYLLASGVLRFLRTHALPRCGTPKRPQYPFTPGGYCGRGGRHTGRHRTLSLRWPDAAPNPVSHHPASPVSSFLSPTRRPPIDALLSSENQQQQQQQGRAAKRR